MAHVAISNVFTLASHLIRTETCRHKGEGTFVEWVGEIAPVGAVIFLATQKVNFSIR